MTAAVLRDGARALGAALLALVAACAIAPGSQVPRETGVLRFELPTPNGPLAIRAYVPEQGAERAPVWVVMHGQRRDADDYFQAWLPHARSLRAILVVPEFDKGHWPRSFGYQLGNVMTSKGVPVPPERWAFTAVDRAVDETLRRAARAPESARVAFYGHGAGAQFVQRYVLQMDTRRVSVAIAAAAGWYLLPDRHFDFPYGLRDLPLPEARLRAACMAPAVVLVGQSDLRDDGVIRRNATADEQGVNRVARARFYIENARSACARLGADFAWRLQEEPGVGHREADMVPAALALLKSKPGE